MQWVCKINPWGNRLGWDALIQTMFHNLIILLYKTGGAKIDYQLTLKLTD